jgi:uncharacterized caspase-like protein
MSKDTAGHLQTVAVILGASAFDRAPQLAQGRAFYNSAHDFHRYLIGCEGLSVGVNNVLNLFDDTRSPSDQLNHLATFLEARRAAFALESGGLSNLIVYYVGHGLFSGADRAYCLAVRNTDSAMEGINCIRSSDLAAAMRGAARFVRKFLILDCCFSSAAYKEFQSGPLEVGRLKLFDQLPRRGTALLCSASSHDASLAPEGLSHTMFTSGLLLALKHGHPRLGDRLSLSELGDLVKARICANYPETWVRPEVHSPDQREGDVADVPLFPNGAHRTSTNDRRRAAERVDRQHTELERKATQLEESHGLQEQVAPQTYYQVKRGDVATSKMQVSKTFPWTRAAVLTGLILVIVATAVNLERRDQPTMHLPVQTQRPIEQAASATDQERSKIEGITSLTGVALRGAQVLGRAGSRPSNDQLIQPSDREIREFVDGLLKMQAHADPSKVIDLYADRVDYFGQHGVDRNFILADKTNYYRRWPKLENQLDGPIDIQRSASDDTVKISYRTRWAVEAPARNARKTGTANDELSLHCSNGRLLIVAQKQQVFAQ